MFYPQLIKMKIQTLFSLLLLSLLFTTSCKEKQEIAPVDSFVILGTIQDSTTNRIFATVETALDHFSCDTLSVTNNQFSFVFPTDSVVRIRLYTDSISTSFYIDSKDTIKATIYPDSFLIKGSNLHYTQYPIDSFLLLDKDSVRTLPLLLQDHISQYKKNTQTLTVGKKMPYAIFKDLDEKNISTLEMQGTVRLYSFYHTKDTVSLNRVLDLRNVQKKYKNKDIEFIHIALDQNDTIWEKTRKENKLQEGRLVRVKEGFNNRHIRSLGIKTLPYNILVDGKALIVATSIYGDSLAHLLKNHVKNKKPKAKSKSSNSR